jgi:hypothetical protein
MKQALLLLIALVVLATPAWAQQPIATSFGELQGKIRLGQTLFITDNRGTTIEGKLTGLDVASLQVRLGGNEATPPLRLSESNVNNIVVVRRDRWWDGPLIGFAIGGGTAALIEAAQSRGTQKFQGGSIVGFGNLCALVGLTVDLLNKDRVSVYVQPGEPGT